MYAIVRGSLGLIVGSGVDAVGTRVGAAVGSLVGVLEGDVVGAGLETQTSFA